MTSDLVFDPAEPEIVAGMATAPAPSDPPEDADDADADAAVDDELGGEG